MPGLLFVDYTLDGMISSSGNGGAFSDVVLFFDPNTQNSQQRENDYFTSTSGVHSLGAPLNFTFGQPFVFDFSLFTCAGKGLLCLGGQANGVGFGNANFFDTLTLSGLIPTDLNGIEATGAQFTSASGTQYTVNGVAAPEPATLTLTALGLAGAMSRFKRRRSDLTRNHS